MSEWTRDELTRLGNAEELEIASVRPDGTRRKPVTIWVDHGGDSVYVRSVKRPSSAWFRGTQERHESRIRAGGVEKDVTFVNADHAIDEKVDAAYRAKYRRYAGSILNSVLTPQARSTTTKLLPFDHPASR